MSTVVIPAGMVPWQGGDSAPADWIGYGSGGASSWPESPLCNTVCYRDGSTGSPEPREGRWRHNRKGFDGDTRYDIIAYTPTKHEGRPADSVTVPREPTEAMVEAFYEENARADTVFADPRNLWSAMIAAAPVQPSSGMAIAAALKHPNNAWKQYAADFKALTDQEIECEAEQCRNHVDESESWLEAVASWEAAGKPRAALTEPVAPDDGAGA